MLLSALLLFACNQHQNNPNVINTGIPAEHINPTAGQQERRKRSEAICKAHQVPLYVNTFALLTDPEAQTTLRTQDSVIDRALALCYGGVKSEGLEQPFLDKFDRDYHISSKLSPEERAYATATNPTGQQKIDANWRYECMHVMLWALGYIDSLNYPSTICNVKDDVNIIHKLTETQFRQKAKLRSKKEILDQADLILRLDWACVDARTKNLPAPGNLNADVVTERHRALNWLIRHLDEQWDDVSTDT